MEACRNIGRAKSTVCADANFSKFPLKEPLTIGYLTIRDERCLNWRCVGKNGKQKQGYGERRQASDKK